MVPGTRPPSAICRQNKQYAAPRRGIGQTENDVFSVTGPYPVGLPDPVRVTVRLAVPGPNTVGTTEPGGGTTGRGADPCAVYG